MATPPKIILPDAGYDWRCQRCGHQWRSRHPNEKPPVSCSKCRSAYWQTPKKARGEARKQHNEPVTAADRGKINNITEALVDGVELPPPPHLRRAVETESEEQWEVPDAQDAPDS